MMWRRLKCALFGHDEVLSQSIASAELFECHCQRCFFKWIRARTRGL